MEIKEVPISDIKPYANNPRKNDDAVEFVANSIEEFGFKQPIVVDENGVIIAGHTRYKAAKSLRLETVPVLFADDLTEEQVKAYRLADNKVAELAKWDMSMLEEELDGIFDIDMSDFGFEDIEEEISLDEIDEDEVEEDVQEITKPGDRWILGDHVLVCGDSTSDSDMEKLMAGELADLVVTDPPYNVSYEGKTKDALKIKNDSMGNSDFLQFLTDAFATMSAFMKPGAAFYIWHADSEGYNFRKATELAGLDMKQCLIWNKNTLVLGRQDYQWKHEPCLYGWKPGSSHNWYGDRRQTTVIDFDKPSRNGEHPTMKPVGLFAYQMKNSSKQGDIVLDQFGGSGTTIIAAEQLGRKARVMELDPHYCDVIINRWETFTGKKAEREDSDCSLG